MGVKVLRNMLTAERTHREEGQSCTGVHTGTPAEDTRHKHSHGVRTQDYKKKTWLRNGWRSGAHLAGLHVFHTCELVGKDEADGGGGRGLMEPEFSSSDGVVKDGCRRDADMEKPQLQGGDTSVL